MYCQDLLHWTTFDQGVNCQACLHTILFDLLKLSLKNTINSEIKPQLPTYFHSCIRLRHFGILALNFLVKMMRFYKVHYHNEQG